MVEKKEKQIHGLSWVSVLQEYNYQSESINNMKSCWILVNPKPIDLVVTNDDKEMKNNSLLLQGDITGKTPTS